MHIWLIGAGLLILLYGAAMALTLLFYLVIGLWRLSGWVGKLGWQLGNKIVAWRRTRVI